MYRTKELTLLKRILASTMIAILLISLAACSQQEKAKTVSNNIIPTPTAAGTEKANETEKVVTVEVNDNSSPTAMLKKISREDSGLDKIERLDFGGFTINSRINEILKDWKSYRDEDYKNGIVHEDGSIIVGDRFTGDIIGGIRIGTGMDTVRSVLGNPSFSYEDFLFYKANQFYFGVKGKEKVEQAIFENNPKEYDPQILEAILKELNKPDYEYLSNSLEENDTLSDFFDANGHINGGGWYADSDNGINVQEFDEDTVTVYNNFEGELFKYDGLEGKFKIIYANEDYIVQWLSLNLNGYVDTNERFETEGVVSPGGKYKSLYDWVYSMSQYFTVRTMDNSKPDKRLPATSQDYRWLNDKYILYIHAFYGIPYIINVEDDSQEHIDVLYDLGVIKEKYFDSIGDFNLKIEDIKDGVILLSDEKSKKTYTIKYSFDSEGLINLSLEN